MPSPLPLLGIIRKDLDLILFYAFLWTIPFTWRIVLVPDFTASPLPFHEYTDFSLYVSEMVLVCALLIHILRNKTYYKSIYKNGWEALKNNDVFHVEHISFLLFIFLGLLFLSALLSEQRMLSFLNTFHLIPLTLIYPYVQSRFVPRGTKAFYPIITIFLISSLSQGIIGFFQTITGQSLGLRFLGESILSVSELNIAKLSYFGDVFLRSYGTFLHPNILGGFIAFTFILAYSSFRHLFHVKHMVFIVLIGILLLSGSKSAIFSLGIILILSMFHVKQLYKKFHMEQIVYILILSSIFIAHITVFQREFFQGTQDRIDYITETDINPSLFGNGLSTSTVALIQNADPRWFWGYEPIHNIYLLAFKELGVIGTLFLGVIVYLIVSRGTLASNAPLFLILSIGLFDHYPWDIYSGQALFWFAVASTQIVDKTE
jgi:O-antigen ligase